MDAVLELAVELPVVTDVAELLPATALVGGPARRLAKLLRPRKRGVRSGSLRRTEPLSAYYGLDRGIPVDRVHIERFLERHAGDVRGRVLEVRDRGYTLAYGRGERADGRRPSFPLVACARLRKAG